MGLNKYYLSKDTLENLKEKNLEYLIKITENCISTDEYSIYFIKIFNNRDISLIKKDLYDLGFLKNGYK